MIEAHYLVHGEETTYRVRPSPDGEALNGDDGVLLEWRDAGEEEWKGSFFISPQAAHYVAEAIARLSRPRK